MPQTIVTQDSEYRVLFNDGEGLEHGDLNDALQVPIDALIANMASKQLLDYAFVASAPTIRPFRSAGMLFRDWSAVGFDITVEGGVWFFDGSPAVQLFVPDTPFTVDTPDATFDRIDIISVKNTPLDTAPISRDFKDAITGALTTTVFDKRRMNQLTVTYTPGAPAASPVAPAPPGGETVLQEILVTAAAISLDADSVTDYRTPAGYWRRFIRADQMATNGTLFVSATDLRIDLASGDVAMAPLIPDRPEHRGILSGNPEGAGDKNLRINRITLIGKIDPATTGVVEVIYRDYEQPLGVWSVPPLPGIGSPQITSLTGASVAHRVADFDTATLPVLWANGQTHPNYDSAFLFDMVAELRMRGDAGGSDLVRGVVVEGYGVLG